MKEVSPPNKSFVFGDFRLDKKSQILTLNGREIHLPKRPFYVLTYLVENRERIVSRNELFDKFWDGHDVYDDALRKTVGAIRHAIDDTQKPPRFIETRYGSGYRFIGTVEEILENTNGNGNLGSVKPNLNIDLNNEFSSKSNRQNFPYILIAILLVSVLFFVSLGFYVYFPKDKQNFSPNNLVQTTAPIRSIAILPLKNLTGDVNNEYFSEGITESIIAELSRVDELKVISRSSTFALKDRETDPQEIGKKLNVDALLEGSLQKKGETVSVNVRLISTRDGSVLWTSKDFERPISNAYELQDIISCNIAIELRTELCDIVPKRNTNNSDAYQAYLKGRYQWNKRTGDGIKKSIEFYEQAIKLDSKYALAYAGLSESYVQGIWHVPFDSKEVLSKAEKAAQTAIELDETLAEAHTALANVYELNWNWSEAERELKHAIELNPRYARAHHVLAFYYLTLGRNDEAVASIEQARELDPLNLVINTDKANILFSSNRTEEAFQQWTKTLELDPNFALVHLHRSIAYQSLGNETAAIEEWAKSLELNGKSAQEVAEYRGNATKNGLKGFYQKELNKLLAQEKRGENVSFISLAIYNSLLGQKDEAFKYLEKAFNKRSAEMVLIKPDTRFALLRSDPRFADLIKRLGLPE